jgi:hypothetical protein
MTANNVLNPNAQHDKGVVQCHSEQVYRAGIGSGAGKSL